MFIASGTGYLNERETVAAPFIIGNIRTVMGHGTLTRANGTLVNVAVRGPVCRGDIIETASDGLIVIDFIDGTVVNLPGCTRIVLDDGIACNADDIARSPLLTAGRGLVAFVAAQLAKRRILRGEKTAGSGNGAQASGFGLLSLAALTFGVIKDAQASDPNITLLDDDSITYKDLGHGSFELVTKEPVPRHIIVDDPGETVVISKNGSSISVVGNTPGRMEELQQAQQDILDLATRGVGPSGSGTPPFVKTLPVEPINFIQPDAPSTMRELAPSRWIDIPAPTIPLVFPPTLTVGAGPVEVDTVAFDTFTATSGVFSSTNLVSGSTLTFGIGGGAGGSTVLAGVTYDVSATGPYGTLYLNGKTGAWTFVPNSDAINALQAPTTESFVITVSDGLLTTNETFTVAINGTNDRASISGITSGAVIEAGGIANATPGSMIATGLLTDIDVDNPPNTFTVVNPPRTTAGSYGSFTMTASGVWTYELDNTNPTVQALNVGGTLTDSFTVTSIDGTPQDVTITISGTNDAAIISGTTSGSVTEAGSASPGTPTATGTLTDADVDNAPNLFTAVLAETASDHDYGTFTMAASGVWIYTLDNTNSAVRALNIGDILTDSFTVSTFDGTSQTVTITINGSNDGAIISGTTSGTVIEAGGVANAFPGTPTATGVLTDTDVDNTPNTFVAVARIGDYGTFTMTMSGQWTYELDNTNPAVQALNVGGTLTDSFTVTSIDGTLQVVSITISGTNDAAIVTGTTSGSVIEAGGASPGAPTVTGTLTDTDVDNLSNTFTEVSRTLSNGGYGTFTVTAAGVWTYSLDNNNSVVQALDAGDSLIDTFTVTTVDGTAVVVTITIVGASDADPNDFDNLATGTAVITKPPYVFGTPGDDSVAGGGDTTQIVYGGAGNDTLNGTGVDDTIYGGSGNDTIKGNGGDDTIYGGSGNDTINGNNGNDIIIGGFGADKLTGSNGDDHFVYLSVADSNAVQFDSITDFVSGSDKIDLTAFGPLAFLASALSSKTATVPPHTIAWLYDGAANETIVYVNPTDQALTIGDSGLLEIHLQGISTVQTQDFILASVTAPAVVASGSINLSATTQTGTTTVGTTGDVSSATTVGDSARFADGDWALRSVLMGYGIDAALGQFAWSDHRSEAATGTTEYALDDFVNPPSGRSIELPHATALALSTTGFALDQVSAHDKYGTSIHEKTEPMTAQGPAQPDEDRSGGLSDAGTTGGSEAGFTEPRVHGSALAEDRGATNSTTHLPERDIGASVATNSKALGGSESNGIAKFSTSGEAHDHGTSLMQNAGGHGVEPSSMAHIAFGAAAMTTAHEGFHFGNDSSALDHSASKGVARLDHTSNSTSDHPDTASAHGLLRDIVDMQATELPSHGRHAANNLEVGADHAIAGADHAAAVAHAAAAAHAHQDLIV